MKRTLASKWCIAACWLGLVGGAAAAGEVKHRFVCVDNRRNLLLCVDQHDPAKNWSTKIPAGSRDLQAIQGRRLLVSHGNGAAEYDLASGRRLPWSVDRYTQVNTAQRLANGKTLLGANTAAGVAIYELDRDGKEVGRRVLPGLKDLRLLRRLDNGHILLTASGPCRALEFDARGNVAWQAPLPDKGYKAVRLPGGHTLVSTGGESTVVEFDGAGKVVSTVGGKKAHPALGLDWASGFDILPNGNVVLANWLGHGQLGKGPHLVEFDRQNRVVWQWGSEAPEATITNVLVLDAPESRAGTRAADWLHEARWGVMTHYLGAPPSSSGGAELTAEAWNKQIDEFNVAGLAEQLSSAGVKYLLFTIGQNSGHYCAPNAAYDRIVGIVPSKCSRRDLIADLAKQLKPRGIRLMVYLPSGAPAADPAARKKLQWRWGQPGAWQLPGEPVGGRLVEFQNHWESVIREWSLRWGRNVSGWWIDGCYFADEMYRHPQRPNFASFAAALKAGNPDAIVAFNPGVRVPVAAHAECEDFAAGEVNLDLVPKALDTCRGRWLAYGGGHVQYHLLTYLGISWCQGDRPKLPDAQVADYVRRLAQQGGAITFDVPIRKDGLIPPPFAEQLRGIHRELASPGQR